MLQRLLENRLFAKAEKYELYAKTVIFFRIRHPRRTDLFRPCYAQGSPRAKNHLVSEATPTAGLR